MPQARTYSNAPITEAIIDLRVRPRTEIGVAGLADVNQGDEPQYPKSEPIFRAEVTSTFTEGAPPHCFSATTAVGIQVHQCERQVDLAITDGRIHVQSIGPLCELVAVSRRGPATLGAVP